MMKGVWPARVIAAAFFAFLGALAGGRAHASVFCAADVAFMTPWNAAADAPSVNAASTLYAFDLEGDAAATLGGHIVLVTDTKAYKVAFDRVQLLQSRSGETFVSDGAFISLPHSDAVRYAWVDDITDDSGKTNDCPTFPYAVTALGDEERRAATPPSSGSKGVYKYESTMAQFAMDLPPLSCPQPYRKVELLGTIPDTTNYYDDVIVHDPVVHGRVDIDSEGKVINVQILKSSGSIAFDQDARETYGTVKYKPQLFRCEPVVSSYYFSLKYYSRR